MKKNILILFLYSFSAHAMDNIDNPSTQDTMPCPFYFFGQYLAKQDDLDSATQKIKIRLKALKLSSQTDFVLTAVTALERHFNPKYNKLAIAAALGNACRHIDPSHFLSIFKHDDQSLSSCLQSPELQALAQTAVEQLLSCRLEEEHLSTSHLKVITSLNDIFPFNVRSKFAFDSKGKIVHDTKKTDLNAKDSLVIRVTGESELQYRARIISHLSLDDKLIFSLRVKKYGNDKWTSTRQLADYEWGDGEPTIHSMSILQNDTCLIAYGKNKPDRTYFTQSVTDTGQALLPVKHVLPEPITAAKLKPGSSNLLLLEPK